MKLSFEKQRLLAIAALLLWCSALIFYRLYLEHESYASGLLWNLFLAFVPLLWSVAFQAAMARKRSALAGLYFMLWLLFLPNAPYILTDLIHVSPRPHVPLWFMVAMYLSCAGTGTLLGYLSLINVQNVIRQRFGALAGWILAVFSLMGCGFGIYVGRFLRWNSWDALTHPLELGKDISHQLSHLPAQTRPLSVTLIYGVGLILGYFALRVVALSIQQEPIKTGKLSAETR